MLALGPPATPEGTLAIASLAFLLGIVLVHRLKGPIPAAALIVFAMALVWALIGLLVIGLVDRNGVLPCLVGLAVAGFASFQAKARPVPPGRQQNVPWLAVWALSLGPALGLIVYGLWYWNAGFSERKEAWEYLVTDLAFGGFAGIVVAVLIVMIHFIPRPRDGE